MTLTDFDKKINVFKIQRNLGLRVYLNSIWGHIQILSYLSKLNDNAKLYGTGKYVKGTMTVVGVGELL